MEKKWQTVLKLHLDCLALFPSSDIQTPRTLVDDPDFGPNPGQSCLNP